MERLVWFCFVFFLLSGEYLQALFSVIYLLKTIVHVCFTGVLVSYRKRHKHKMSFFPSLQKRDDSPATRV